MMSPEERKIREQISRVAQVLAKRGESDPLKLWQATAAQRPFIKSVIDGTCPENWFVASNRSGKSDAGANAGARLARFGNPNSRYVKAVDGVEMRDRATAGWVAGVDFPTSRDVLQPKYFDNGNVPPGATHRPFIPAHEILSWNNQESTLKLKNGSIIVFKSYDSGRTKFQGSERDWIHFDEEPPHPIYEESSIRVGSRMLRIFGTCTLLPPEGTIGGVSWLFPKIIQPWQDGTLEDANVFTASIYSNPHLSQDDIKRLEARYPVGSPERRIRLDGELLPGIGGARAFGSFDRKLHVAQQPPIALNRPLCFCVDFNVAPLCAAVGQRDDNTFRFYDEIYLEMGSIPDLCQEYYNRYGQHPGGMHIYGDATGNNRHAQTNSDNYQLILQHFQKYGLSIRMNVPYSNPPVPRRIAATNNALVNADGDIHVSVSPTCKELIADFEGVLLDNNGGIKKTSNRKDPYFNRTHMVDGATYWIVYEMPVEMSDPKHMNKPAKKHNPYLPDKRASYGFQRRR